MGFFKWVRQRVHGTGRLDANDAEDFDEATSELIASSDALLNRMRAEGINPAAERRITHLFVGQDRDLGRASYCLGTLGYLVEESGEGRLLISEHGALNEMWVRRVMPTMAQIAGEFELIYDGWDADVTADHTGQDN